MLEEQALVVEVMPGAVLVETCRQSACQSCSAKSSCGHSLLAKLSSGKRQQLTVATEMTLHPGDQVVLGLGEGAFLRGSALLYLVPLLVMLLAALVGEVIGGQDSALSFILAAAGLSAGFGGVRWYTRRHGQDAQYQPVVLRKLPVGDIPVVGL